MLACVMTLILTGCEEDSQKANFKTTFTVEWPNNTAERDAIRPTIFDGLKKLQTEVEALQAKAASERSEANGLPYNGQQNIERRIAAFHHCEESEAHLSEVSASFMAAGKLVIAAGFTRAEVKGMCGLDICGEY